MGRSVYILSAFRDNTDGCGPVACHYRPRKLPERGTRLSRITYIHTSLPFDGKFRVSQPRQPWILCSSQMFCPFGIAQLLGSENYRWKKLDKSKFFGVTKQTWSGFSLTTVPENNRQTGLSPTTVPAMSIGQWHTVQWTHNIYDACQAGLSKIVPQGHDTHYYRL